MTIDGVDIYIEPISDGPRGSRREAERAAVARIVWRVFGAGVTVDHYADGAPYIPGFDGTVSVSHSRDMAVLAVDRKGRGIGVDAEQWRRTLRTVADRLLEADERAWLADDATLLAAWTIKEAVYKALRPGGGMNMLQVVLPPVPAEQGIASGVDFTTTVLDKHTITVAIKS